MRQIILASHGKMASGLAHTLQLIAGTSAPIHSLDAYSTNTPVADEVAAVLEPIGDDIELVILTDLIGGSVNQEFSKIIATRPRTTLISGMNLPLALSIALLPGDSPLDEATIRRCIADAQQGITYVNALDTSAGDDDE